MGNKKWKNKLIVSAVTMSTLAMNVGMPINAMANEMRQEALGEIFNNQEEYNRNQLLKNPQFMPKSSATPQTDYDFPGWQVTTGLLNEESRTLDRALLSRDTYHFTGWNSGSPYQQVNVKIENNGLNLNFETSKPIFTSAMLKFSQEVQQIKGRTYTFIMEGSGEKNSLPTFKLNGKSLTPTFDLTDSEKFVIEQSYVAEEEKQLLALNMSSNYLLNGPSTGFKAMNSFLKETYGDIWSKIDALYTDMNHQELAEGVTLIQIEAIEKEVAALSDTVADKEEMQELLNKAKDLLPEVGTLSPDIYTMGTPEITGSFDGEITSAKLFVDNKEVDTGSKGSFDPKTQKFTFPVGNQKLTTSQKVELIGLNKDNQAITEKTPVTVKEAEVKFTVLPYTEGDGVLKVTYPKGTKSVQFALNKESWNVARNVSVDPTKTEASIELTKEELNKYVGGQKLDVRLYTAENQPSKPIQIIIGKYTNEKVNYAPYTEGEKEIVVYHSPNTVSLQVGLDTDKWGALAPLAVEKGTTRTVVKLTPEQIKTFVYGRSTDIRSKTTEGKDTPAVRKAILANPEYRARESVDALFRDAKKDALANGVVQETITNAETKVNALENGAVKTELTELVKRAQSFLDAQTVVDDLFKTPDTEIREDLTQEDIDDARKVVKAIYAGAWQNEQNARIDVAQKLYNDTLPNGTIKPDEYFIGNKAIYGAVEGDIVSGKLFINGQETTQEMLLDSETGRFRILIGDYKIAITDNVEVVGYNQYNKEVRAKVVLHEAEKQILFPRTYYVGDTRIKGSADKSIKAAKLIINGEEKETGGDYNGHGFFNFKVEKYNIKATDRVELIPINQENREQGRHEVEIDTVQAEPIKVFNYKLGSKEIFGTHNRKNYEVTLRINGQDTSYGTAIAGEDEPGVSFKIDYVDELNIKETDTVELKVRPLFAGMDTFYVPVTIEK